MGGVGMGPLVLPHRLSVGRAGLLTVRLSEPDSVRRIHRRVWSVGARDVRQLHPVRGVVAQRTRPRPVAAGAVGVAGKSGGLGDLAARPVGRPAARPYAPRRYRAGERRPRPQMGPGLSGDDHRPLRTVDPPAGGRRRRPGRVARGRGAVLLPVGRDVSRTVARPEPGDQDAHPVRQPGLPAAGRGGDAVQPNLSAVAAGHGHRPLRQDDPDPVRGVRAVSGRPFLLRAEDGRGHRRLRTGQPAHRVHLAVRDVQRAGLLRGRVSRAGTRLRAPRGGPVGQRDQRRLVRRNLGALPALGHGGHAHGRKPGAAGPRGQHRHLGHRGH